MKNVSGAGYNTVIIWDTTTRKIDYKLQGHTWGITSVVISHDGKKIIFGAVDNI